MYKSRNFRQNLTNIFFNSTYTRVIKWPHKIFFSYLCVFRTLKIDLTCLTNLQFCTNFG